MTLTFLQKTYLVQKYHNHYVAPLLIHLIYNPNSTLPLDNIDFYINLLTSIVSNLSKNDIHKVNKLKNAIILFYNSILQITPQDKYIHYLTQVREILDNLNIYIYY